MSIKLSDFAPEFRTKIDQLIVACAARGVRMVPTEGLRTPWQQAIYSRQSRSIVEIRRAPQMLRDNGAEFLANVLDSLVPRAATK